MATQPASTVIAHFATRIDTITSESVAAGFVRSGYRLTLGEEPDSAIDGLYFVDVDSIGPPGPHFGTAESIFTLLQVLVEVGYYRGGGDLGPGDRQSVLRNAADDMQRLADVLPHPDYYSGETTGIRRIIFQGANRVIDKPRAEVWQARFLVEWRSDLITT